MVRRRLKDLLDHLGREQVIVETVFSLKTMYVSKTIKYLYSLGVRQVRLTPSSIGPNDSTISLPEPSGLLKEYGRLIDFLKDTYNRDDPIIVEDLTTQIHLIHNKIKIHRHCDAGINRITVTPNGDIYPCHRLVGTIHKIGNVSERLVNLENYKVINCNVDDKHECAGCWIRYFCGGGCYAEAFFVNHDITSIDNRCDFRKQLVELIIGKFIPT